MTCQKSMLEWVVGYVKKYVKVGDRVCEEVRLLVRENLSRSTLGWVGMSRRNLGRVIGRTKK